VENVSGYDVYRGSIRIATVTLTGHVDNTGWRGSPSTTYQVCAADDTSTCSEVVVADW
jgi:hypothetical protein